MEQASMTVVVSRFLVRSHFTHRVAAWAVAWTLATCASGVVAQEAAKRPANWKELQIAEPKGGYRAAKAQAEAMVRSGPVADEQTFDAYWKWHFAQLTRYELRNKLPAIRSLFKQKLKDRQGAAQARLVKEIALPMLTEIVEDAGYDTIVRYNALLMLGDLNQTEPNARGQGAVALAEALPTLLKFLDPKLPANDTNDTLRVAALIGVQGHAERGGVRDAQRRQQVQKLLQQIADETNPPVGRQPEVHEWITNLAKVVAKSMQPAGSVASGRSARMERRGTRSSNER